MQKQVSDFVNLNNGDLDETPDIVASFVHGSLRRAGWGGEVAATVQTLPLLASPSLSTSDG